MKFKLHTQNNCENTTVFIDGKRCLSNEKIQGTIFEADLDSGWHTIKIVKKGIYKFPIFISWLSIICGFSEYTWNDIKASNLEIKYYGKFYIENEICTSFYFTKQGIEFDDLYVVYVYQHVKEISKTNVFWAYKFPLLIMLLLVIGLFLFASVNLFANGKILESCIVILALALLLIAILRIIKKR